jgi:hypothetical protein
MLAAADQRFRLQTLPRPLFGQFRKVNSRKVAPGLKWWHHAHRWKGSRSLAWLPASRWGLFLCDRILAGPVAAGCRYRLDALGWTVTWAVGVDVERGYAVFGSTGALTFAAITGLAMLPMLRGRTR